MPLPYLLSLLAAVLYAAAALLVKRSADLKVDVWRTAFVSNMILGVAFQPLWLLGGELHVELWWQPTLVALTFIAGQLFTFLSLQKGDVSVATPVLGIKILLVAFLVTLWGNETVRPELWAAAALATTGIALLNRRRTAAHHHVGRTIVLAGLAALSFTLFDVLVQTFSPQWGLGRFLPLALGLGGALSVVFLPLFPAPLTTIPRAAWPWLLGGSAMLAAQSLLFVSTIAHWGQAASCNVIFSSRGLWSVLLVWLAGHWFRSREQHLGARILGWRLAGAVLMLSAIALVLEEKPSAQRNRPGTSAATKSQARID